MSKASRHKEDFSFTEHNKALCNVEHNGVKRPVMLNYSLKRTLSMNIRIHFKNFSTSSPWRMAQACDLKTLLQLQQRRKERIAKQALIVYRRGKSEFESSCRE